MYQNNLPYVTLHSLRHTNATLMIAEGTDVCTVSKRLGHANTATTLNIYAHALKSKDREAANNLESVLGNCAKVG
ncbi:MAG: tyrosine-type recombinase/integrase [Clostridia bacterium]|nr:tyrosine-type recombinase/integrase [Clostridia bacterium]